MNKKVKKLRDEFKLNEAKNLNDALAMLPKLSISKFDGSVDIDIVLNLKESQKKESVRGSVTLPNRFGEDKKVIVFCDEKDAKVALSAGATLAGMESLAEKVEKNEVEFDIVLATPSAMPKLVKLGKVLGPRGLMPNPKNGTISDDIESMVKSFKSGKSNFRMTPDQGTVRASIAKVSMTSEQIKENLQAFLKAVFSEVKKLNPQPFKRVTLSPSMGPGVKLELSDIIGLVS